MSAPKRYTTIRDLKPERAVAVREHTIDVVKLAAVFGGVLAVFVNLDKCGFRAPWATSGEIRAIKSKVEIHEVQPQHAQQSEINHRIFDKLEDVDSDVEEIKESVKEQRQETNRKLDALIWYEKQRR